MSEQKNNDITNIAIFEKVIAKTYSILTAEEKRSLFDLWKSLKEEMWLDDILFMGFEAYISKLTYPKINFDSTQQTEEKQEESTIKCDAINKVEVTKSHTENQKVKPKIFTLRNLEFERTLPAFNFLRSGMVWSGLCAPSRRGINIGCRSKHNNVVYYENLGGQWCCYSGCEECVSELTLGLNKGRFFRFYFSEDQNKFILIEKQKGPPTNNKLDSTPKVVIFHNNEDQQSTQNISPKNHLLRFIDFERHLNTYHNNVFGTICKNGFCSPSKKCWNLGCQSEHTHVIYHQDIGCNWYHYSGCEKCVHKVSCSVLKSNCGSFYHFSLSMSGVGFKLLEHEGLSHNFSF